MEMLEHNGGAGALELVIEMMKGLGFRGLVFFLLGKGGKSEFFGSQCVPQLSPISPHFIPYPWPYSVET